MAKTINVKLTQIIFSDYPNLTMGVNDLAKEAGTLTFEGDFTNRLAGATGSILSPNLYVVGTMSFKALKTSPQTLEFWKQIQKTTILEGTATFNGDFAFEATARQLDVSVGEISADGSQAFVEVVIKGDFTINAQTVI